LVALGGLWEHADYVLSAASHQHIGTYEAVSHTLVGLPGAGQTSTESFALLSSPSTVFYQAAELLTVGIMIHPEQFEQLPSHRGFKKDTHHHAATGQMFWIITRSNPNNA